MIYIIHDNVKWLWNLRKNLESEKLEYTEWDLSEGNSVFGGLDFNNEPPMGVYYNRVSASGFSRNARYSLEYSLVIVQWLESYGRRVINGSDSIAIELNKVKQFLELKKVGLKSPAIYLASNKKEIIKLANDNFFEKGLKCIIKDNRSGSGIGVKLVDSPKSLLKYLDSDGYSRGIDGITLVQQYIESPEPYIIRMEYVNGKLLYALKINTSDGFQLCPADKCNIGNKSEKFKLITADQFPYPKMIPRYLELLKKNGIEVCGMEFIIDKEGEKWTYDINCNTNYNLTAETKAGIPNSGNQHLIKLLNE